MRLSALAPRQPVNPQRVSPPSSVIQAPVHILVIPKSRDGLTQLSKAVESNKPLLGHLMFVAQKVAKDEVRPPSCEASSSPPSWLARARCSPRSRRRLPRIRSASLVGDPEAIRDPLRGRFSWLALHHIPFFLPGSRFDRRARGCSHGHRSQVITWGFRPSHVFPPLACAVPGLGRGIPCGGERRAAGVAKRVSPPPPRVGECL